MGAILRPFPNVLQPRGRIKPAGIPRIDWTHPLASKLVACWYAFDGGLIDLVSGRIAGPFTATNRMPMGASPYGAALNFNAAAAYVDGGGAGVAFRIQTWAATYSFAAIWYQKVLFSGATTTQIFSFNDSSNNGTWGIGYSASNTLQTTYGNGPGSTLSPAPAVGFHSFVGVATSATTAIDIYDGVQTTDAATGTASPASTTQEINVATLNGLAAGSAMNAMVFLGLAWNARALNLQDALLLHTDPYCFLLPQESEMPALFVAAGVTSFTMTAATGNYTLTQEQEKLLKTSIDNVQSGSYALTGEQVKTLKGSKVTAQSGSYLLTGEQITALKKSIENIQAGTYATSSQPVLKKTSLQNIQEGSYALTDETLKLAHGYLIKVQQALYSLTDEQLVLLKTNVDKLQSGAYALTDEQLTLLKKSIQFVQEVPYALTVESLTLSTIIQFLMSIGAGTYSLTDEQLTLLKTSLEKVQSGAYALTDEQIRTLKASALNPFPTAYALNDSRGIPPTVVLFHFDGTNGSTTFTDTAARHTSVVALGTVALDTSKFEFGTASAKFSTNSQITVQLNRDDLWFGTGDFTIDFWINFSVLNGSNPIQWDDDTNNDPFMVVQSNGQIQWTINSGTLLSSATGAVSAGAWTHIALTRASNTLRCFVSGTQSGSSVTDNTYYGHPIIDPIIGPMFGAGGTWVDEFRVLQGFAAWTANFTPPTAPYVITRLGNETLLWDHADKAQTGFYNLAGESLTFAFSGAGSPATATAFAFLFGMGPFAGNAFAQEPVSVTTSVTAFTMLIGSGTYSLTDEFLTLLKTSKIGTRVGVYSLTDEQLTFLKGSALKASSGTYTFTGEQLTLKAARLEKPQAGFYAQTGENLKELKASLTNAQTGFYNLAGGSITLATAFPGQFSMSIGTGTYVLTGENVTLIKKSDLGLQATTYSLTGEPLQALKGSRLGVTVGTYTLTGEALKLNAGHAINAQTGFYTFTSALTFRKKSLLNSATGFYVVSRNGLNLLTIITPIISNPNLFGVDTGVALSGTEGVGTLFGSQNAGINLAGGESVNTLLGSDSVPGIKGSV